MANPKLKKTQKPLVLLSDLLELPSKKQKVFVSCKGATAGSPQYVSTHFLPRSLNALEILTVNFWISFFGCFSNFKACLILIILFVGGVSGHSSPVKALTDWNGSCSIPLSVMLLKQLATASQRQMQSCKTPMLTDHSQRLRNMPHVYTFVEYHHLNMRISTCHVCLPYNWFVCHLVSTEFQSMPCVRKPPDLEGSPQLWHHFLSATDATGDGICYPAITKFSSCRTESISTSAKIVLN